MSAPQPCASPEHSAGRARAEQGGAAHSALYFGSLRHRRLGPSTHVFRRRLFMVYLDLDELEQVFEGRWLWSIRRPAVAWFRRADYFGDPAVPLGRAVRERVAAELGFLPRGPVRMLTHLRYFGYSFNPVTFYYCFDAAGTAVEAILAEITNTPWKERHGYVLDLRGRSEGSAHRFRKSFHVSPFMDLAYEYEWSFTRPGAQLGVHMRNLREGKLMFEATLSLRRREIKARSLAAALARFPLMSLQVIGSIYWQALRLWLKRIPVHAHPSAQRVLPDAPGEGGP